MLNFDLKSADLNKMKKKKYPNKKSIICMKKKNRKKHKNNNDHYEMYLEQIQQSSNTTHTLFV